MKCVHEIEIGCTYCSGKETTQVTPKRIKVAKRAKKHAKASPAMVIARKVAKGELCEKCLTPTGIKLVERDGELNIDHVGLGCQCSRRTDYQAQMLLSTDWLQDHVADFVRTGATDAARALRSADMIVSGLAFSTQVRASRRAGLVRDENSDGTTPGCSEQQNERLQMLDDFGVEPKWHAARNQEADKLPV